MQRLLYDKSVKKLPQIYNSAFVAEYKGLSCDEKAISLLIVPLKNTLPQNCTHIVAIKVVRIINYEVISSFQDTKREEELYARVTHDAVDRRRAEQKEKLHVRV